jgi:hypothetical protein
MTDADFDAAGEVALNAAGYGLVRVGPGRAGLTWLVNRISVAGPATPVLVARVRIYKGEPGSQQLTSSYLGNDNDADGWAETVRSGQYLTAEWSGGTPGDRYTFTLFGKRV